jgi:hypothetical protein
MKTTTGKLGRRQSNGRRFRVLGLAIATALLVIFTQLQRVVAQRGSVEQMMHNYRIMSRVTDKEIAPTPDSLVAAAEFSPLPYQPLRLTLYRPHSRSGKTILATVITSLR